MSVTRPYPIGVAELAVFALGKREKPLMPCREKRDRLLTRRVDHRRSFTIGLKSHGACPDQVDPAGKTNKPAKSSVVFELAHQGRQIGQTAAWRNTGQGGPADFLHARTVMAVGGPRSLPG